VNTTAPTRPEPPINAKVGFEIGNLAPEIVGEDMNGVPFKLSDYRGKVVVLKFWGDWCPPCRAMYPHERSLVAKMKDQPFALIGINSDKNKTRLKQRMKEENLTWRSFWNGPQGTSGPISKAWGVRGWPTIYVIDHQGVIRYKNVRGKAMDTAVEAMIRAVQ